MITHKRAMSGGRLPREVRRRLWAGVGGLPNSVNIRSHFAVRSHFCTVPTLSYTEVMSSA